MRVTDIRTKFLDYFAAHDHEIVPSAAVVPRGDATLLFTNAGMNQFKDAFLGMESRSYTRAASCQKCIRAGGKHNDLEVVGYTARHQTFFEMLGNFSFGDYFKAEAIAFAWDFLVKVLGIPAEDLWVTVHETDDDAAALWEQVDGIAAGRVIRLGDKDNFWQMGDTGPCGPCSEIHVDRGGQYACGDSCGLGTCDCGRFMEVWNNVFMEFDRQPDGELVPLPKPSVDTGMGLERLASVLQNVPTNFDTDVFAPVIAKLVQLSGVAYEQSMPGSPTWESGVPHRVITDHLRTLSFAIADGALPSNEGRGYVLRRILRRAARYGRKLGLDSAFMHELVDVLADEMGDVYPELRSGQQHIASVVRAEEESFGRTLDEGLDRFEKVATSLIDHLGADVFPGDVAFQLYDTYGFPPDLTRILARERELRFDQASFDECMELARARSRAASTFAEAASGCHAMLAGKATEFVGYGLTEQAAHVMVLSQHASAYELVLDRTAFYAESGGQMGDRGLIEAPGGHFAFRVEDTQRVGDAIVHRGVFVQGSADDVEPGMAVVGKVDDRLRAEIRRNHTATHLLHWALQHVVGSHVHQAGSVVEAARLRFDFSHFAALTPEQIGDIETRVNERILSSHGVRTYETTLAEAKERGATALFGEKYGERVRVVEVGGFSKELCGGTHVQHTGEIGLFKVVQETAVQAGVRRIVALTGMAAVAWAQQAGRNLQSLAQVLSTPEEQVLERVSALQNQVKELRRAVKAAKRSDPGAASGSMVEHKVGPVILRHTALKDAAPEDLMALGAKVAKEQRPVVGLFANEVKGRLRLLAACSPAGMQLGCSAVSLLRAVTDVVGGGGGGKPDFAQAGGKDASRLPQGVRAAKAHLSATLSTSAEPKPSGKGN